MNKLDNTDEDAVSNRHAGWSQSAMVIWRHRIRDQSTTAALRKWDVSGVSQSGPINTTSIAFAILLLTDFRCQCVHISTLQRREKEAGKKGNKALSDCRNIASGVQLSKALQCVLWYRVASVSRLFSLSVPPLSPSSPLSSFSLALLPQLVSLSLTPPPLLSIKFSLSLSDTKRFYVNVSTLHI